eukprot:SAG31_NODE_1785_length_7278_cov_4.205321_1_plen_62_part_00
MWSGGMDNYFKQDVWYLGIEALHTIYHYLQVQLSSQCPVHGKLHTIIVINTLYLNLVQRRS